MSNYDNSDKRRNLDSLEAGWREVIIDLMSDGASLAEIKANFRVSNDLHSRWMKDEPDYAEAIKEGLDLSRGWWEKQAREAACGINKDANPTMMIFNLKNRFPNEWRDKREQELTGADGGPIKTDNKYSIEFVNAIPTDTK